MRDTIIENESKAKPGDDPASRIRSPDIASPKGGGVGTCGKYGFCGAYAPIACYTCRKFQAWLDGPHEIVLETVTTDTINNQLGAGQKHVKASAFSRLGFRLFHKYSRQALSRHERINRLVFMGLAHNVEHLVIQF